jgi:hypothetical protein
VKGYGGIKMHPARHFTLTPTQHKRIARSLTKIESDAEFIETFNGKAVTKPKGSSIPDILTASFTEENEFGETQTKFCIHSRLDEFKEIIFTVIKESDFEVDLTMEKGDLTEDNIDTVLKQISKIQTGLRTAARTKKRYQDMTPKEREEAGGPDRKNMCGLYPWRGAITAGSKYWKNYQLAVKLNIASEEMVELLKEWKIHFQDINWSHR